MTAAGIYDQAGKKACKKLWNVFKGQKTRVDDENLLQLFNSSGNEAIADLVNNWDKNTVL